MKPNQNPSAGRQTGGVGVAPLRVLMLLLGVSLATLAILGCADSDQSMSPMGHYGDKDIKAIPVAGRWETAFTADSQTLVIGRLEYPATADFRGFPRYQAFFDRRSRVSHLLVEGDVTSHTPDGRYFTQSYSVSYQTPGDATGQDHAAWELNGVGLYDLPQIVPDRH